MHDDTLAALRLLVLALEAHPEDLEVLQVYGSMGEHLADLIDDYLDEEDEPGRGDAPAQGRTNSTQQL